ncbi:MAG: penicillin-binding protein activator, partial [Myxococcota bacterium]
MSATSLHFKLALLLLALACLMACPTPRPVEPPGIGGPEELDADVPPEALEELERVLALMEQGAFEEAARLLDRVRATYPDSPTAERAGLLQAVLDVRVRPDNAEALDILQAAAEDDGLNLSVRRTAAGYLALRQVGDGNRTRALELLHTLYPGTTPPTLVAEADRQPLLMLLADARRENNDPIAAVEALSWLYQLGDDNGRAFARARMRSIVATLHDDPDTLDLLTRSTDDFIRGYALVGVVERELTSTDVEQAQVQAHMSELSPILLRLNDAALASALESRLQGRDGPLPLRVGALLPLSGSDRRVGQRALGGLLVAQGAFREAEPRGITLVIEDTSSTPQGAAQGVQVLAQKGVSVILGPLSNAEASVAAREAESLGVPLVTMNLERDIVDVGPHTFRLFLDSRREVEVLLNEARRSNTARVMVLYPDVPLGRDVAAQARTLAKELGLSIETLGYPTSTTDFSKLARQVKASKASAVLVPDVGTRVSLLMPYLAAEQLWCTPPGQEPEAGRKALLCLGTVTWLEGALLARTAPYLQGALVAASYTIYAPTTENTRF